jgi:hypothetical protein
LTIECATQAFDYPFQTHLHGIGRIASIPANQLVSFESLPFELEKELMLRGTPTPTDQQEKVLLRLQS